MQDIINTLRKLIPRAAKEELMPRFKNCQIDFKEDGSFITEADIAMQKRLKKELKQHWPEYDFFAEEMSTQQLDTFFTKNSDGFWCLDPIDGTSNFAAGLPFFSVSLALIKKGKTELGIVYDPVRDECFYAISGKGAWLNDNKISTEYVAPLLNKAIALVDFKRLEPALRKKLVIHQPYHSQRSMGSVALDWCWLASKRVHVYLHGKMMLWDYAAGLLIAQESACLSSGLDNRPVYQLGLESRQAMGAVDSKIFDQWKSYLQI